jgi:hypothetical protein
MVFDDVDKREMVVAVSGASLVELEAMRGMLREAVQLVEREIASRTVSQVAVRSAPVEVSVVTSTKPKNGVRGKTVQRKCDNPHCKNVYTARQADLKRGWGRCCSKSCAMTQTLRSNPSHGYHHGGGQQISEEERRERDHQAALSDCELGWDGHKGAF